MAKAIMIQGTMSNAGKSLITAALCRIFVQDGYRVAPFKSQNMALNSYITKDGYEIGRAQAVQAEACGIEPTTDMNPILLKPTTDMGSQVIVNGEVYDNLSASEYFRRKKQLFPEVKKAYDRLDGEYDIIVIEGAGSPAEINLKSDDIVNMGMAKLANAPVLLIGDIDRGGVFAQLYGTIALLEKEERDMIKGLIINKFRGDVSILKPGLTMFEERLAPMPQIPFAGVIPYTELDIEDEDSLSERLEAKTEVKLIDIAVIRLPKLSNFTDMNVFERFERVSVRYVSSIAEFRHPDMIILPGTKSTIEDLRWLRSSGLEAMIKKKASQGTLVFGICGGFQMLGKYLSDPYGVEGNGEIRGMELLSTATFFAKEKTRTQVNKTLHGITGSLACLNGKTVNGYEIHMGITELLVHDFEDDKVQQAKEIDTVLSNGNVYGTYIHGFFDEGEIAKKVVEALCAGKELSAETVLGNEQNLSHTDYKNMQYDKLADTVRKALDMDLIYRILQKGI